MRVAVRASIEFVDLNDLRNKHGELIVGRTSRVDLPAMVEAGARKQISHLKTLYIVMLGFNLDLTTGEHALNVCCRNVVGAKFVEASIEDLQPFIAIAVDGFNKHIALTVMMAEKIEIPFDSVSDQQLINIASPIRVFVVEADFVYTYGDDCVFGAAVHRQAVILPSLS